MLRRRQGSGRLSAQPLSESNNTPSLMRTPPSPACPFALSNSTSADRFKPVHSSRATRLPTSPKPVLPPGLQSACMVLGGADANQSSGDDDRFDAGSSDDRKDGSGGGMDDAGGLRFVGNDDSEDDGSSRPGKRFSSAHPHEGVLTGWRRALHWPQATLCHRPLAPPRPEQHMHTRQPALRQRFPVPSLPCPPCLLSRHSAR